MAYLCRVLVSHFVMRTWSLSLTRLPCCTCSQAKSNFHTCFYNFGFHVKKIMWLSSLKKRGPRSWPGRARWPGPRAPKLWAFSWNPRNWKKRHQFFFDSMEKIQKKNCLLDMCHLIECVPDESKRLSAATSYTCLDSTHAYTFNILYLFDYCSIFFLLFACYTSHRWDILVR